MKDKLGGEGGMLEMHLVGEEMGIDTTQCEESFHEENQVIWLLSSLASRAYTGHW